jgi:hypothetical protein
MAIHCKTDCRETTMTASVLRSTGYRAVATTQNKDTDHTTHAAHGRDKFYLYTQARPLFFSHRLVISLE